MASDPLPAAAADAAPGDINTRLLDAASAADVAEAERMLRAGRLVAVPTETVYGLAADAARANAVRGIFAAKRRPTGHPLIVHLASADRLSAWAIDIPPAARVLADAFWPGPLTMLLHKSPRVPADVTGGRVSVGLRVPDHPVLMRLLERLDTGLAAPSANPHKQLSPTTAAHVMAGLRGRIDAVLDGGPCRVGLESTIVDLTGPRPRIVRAGPIDREQLQSTLGVDVDVPEAHSVVVPGNMRVHYRPATLLQVLERDELVQRLHALDHTARIAVVSYGDRLRRVPAGVRRQVCMPADKADYARELYDVLHRLDHDTLEAIWLQSPPTDEAWRDVHDRLQRASAQ